MAEIQELEVTIDARGEVKIAVKGVAGPACESVTAELEQRLGGQVKERVHHDEYHQQPQGSRRQTDRT